MTGVEKQQREPIHVPVSDLERQTAFQRLEIGWSRLGLDALPPTAADDDRVPRTKVVRPRERDFGRHAQRGMQTSAEPCQQGSMSTVTDRRAGWIDSHRELKADRSQQRRRSLEGQ